MSGKQIQFIDLLKKKYPHFNDEHIYAKILCGDFRVNGETIREPARKVASDAEVEEKKKAFVSRGGDKLFHAINIWELDLSGKVFIDAGCSTGGFTDCLLQSGASVVHAVDVGYNQLDYFLRTDHRVIVHERTNIMDIHSLDPPAQAAVMDLSFRSVIGAASHILSLVSEQWLLALIKPQFEYDPEGDSEFNGVLTDNEVIFHILERVLTRLGQEGVYAQALIESPIKGRKGNTEFLARLSTDEAPRIQGDLLSEIKTRMQERD